MGKIYSFIVYCKISSAKIAPGSASFIDDVTFCLKFLFVFFLFGKAVLFEMASSSFMKVCVDRCKKKYMIQWNLFFGTPLFKRHLHSGDPKFGLGKNVQIIFVFVTTFEGTPPFREKGHFFWVPKPWFKLHSGNTLVLKR